jgi:ISXO2-like transposase domain
MISNLKTWIAGTDHGTSAGHLQVYLDEFTFRSLDLGTHRPPATYRHITT